MDETLILALVAAGVLLTANRAAGATAPTGPAAMRGYQNYMAPSRSGFVSPNYGYGGMVPLTQSDSLAALGASLLGKLGTTAAKSAAVGAAGSAVADAVAGSTAIGPTPTDIPPIQDFGVDAAATAAGADALVPLAATDVASYGGVTTVVADAALTDTAAAAATAAEGAGLWDSIVSFFAFF